MTLTLERWLTLRTHLSQDALGGPRVLKLSWVINLQKVGTLPFVLGLMALTDTWTATAWTYLALHGSYGLIWLMKDLIMPDARWQARITFGGALLSFALVLGPYWLAPILLVRDDTRQPAWLLAGAAIAYALGVVLMMASDAQKHFTLAERPGLITTGFFARVRNPNYLGEMVLYASFAVVAGHVLPWLVLAVVWLGVFLPNMLGKEASMSRYPEWAAYRARTGMLLPRLRRSGAVGPSAAPAPRPPLPRRVPLADHALREYRRAAEAAYPWRMREAPTRADDPVFDRLEAVLPLVSKPVQYIGGELNAASKDWDAAKVRWALMYPDAYEVGLPNQGVQILYEVLNEAEGVLAQRTYSVWPDLERLMRERGIPAFTVDGHRPLGAFDLVGVSFSTELGYTNMLTSLDLAGIPLLAAERRDGDPLVVMGGHAAFNPEPVADFVDLVVLGDGEEAVLAISEVVRSFKAENPTFGTAGGGDLRLALLERLAASGGVYVPALYCVEYLPDGRIARVVPNAPAAPWRVAKHTLMDLDEWPYPKNPLVPLAETVHERLSVEIFRGCTRGCRFCQAGMITRPVRERSTATLGQMIDNGLRKTGFEEVGMLSLSSADHSEIAELAKGLADRYEADQVALSLPSTRVDAFNIDLANELSRNGRRSGLTFAPEGGSERIRQVINKMVTEDDLIATVTAAYGAGWRQVKLYFMCGLPTETDDDVLQIADLARNVIKAGRAAAGTKDIRCTVSIGGFVPKPHTPFQWAAQLDHETTDARLHALRDAIRADREYGRAIGFRYHDGRPGIVEGLLSRGDRRVGRVILEAWRDGARFDGWSEHFSFDRWMAAAERALADAPVDVDWFTTRERAQNEVLPWDHLDSGLDRDWLWQDWEDALAGGEVEDCRWTPCFDCGVCDHLGTQIQVGPGDAVLLPLPEVRPGVEVR